MRSFVATGCLLAVWLLCPASGVAGDGRLQWYTIESEHFIVSYHEPLDDVAKRVAQAAERAHEVLVPSLGYEPKTKTLIVVDDTTDSSNGFASVLPRNQIRIFPSAPPSKSQLSDHDDWLYALIVHEYAHIVHLDNIDGLPYYVNKVVGKTWAPNQLQPRWIIEGIATYEETRATSGGRLRFGLFGMILRMSTLAGDERDLDEMTNGPRAWPHGNTAYLYGSHFLQYIFDRFGHERLAEMSYNFGSNPVPYGLNRSIKLATGAGFVELQKDWERYRQEEFAMQQEAVERAGRREGRRLTFTGEININPRYSRDGKHIIWQHGPGDIEGQYATMPSDGHFGQLSTYAIVRRSGEFDLLSDGSMILEQTDVHHSLYSSQELYRWDRKTEVMHRLTKRKRMRDPAVSPDERQVAFVTTGQARRRLAVMDLVPEAEPRIIWEGPGRYDQAFDPAWSPDGKSVAFSAWRAGGFRDIVIVDLATGKATELAKDRAHDVDPAFDPSGRYLYYSSDRSGIFNVYAYELATGELWQVTNVLGCAVAPAIAPDGKKITYQGYASAGFELYQIPVDPKSWTKAALYVNDRPDPVVIKDDEYKVSAPRPYQPLETLAPKTIQFQADAINRQLTLQLAGNDVVGHHGWNLTGTVDLESGDVDLGGSYSYSRQWVNLRLSGTRTVGERGGYVINDRNTRFLEERISATGSMSLPVLRRAEGSGTISLDYDVDYFRNLEDQFFGPDPNEALPRLPETDMVLAGVAARFSYSDSRGSVYTVGPFVGRNLSLSMRLDDPALGSDFRALNLSYRLQTYYKLPLGRTPVMSLRFSGGIRVSDRRNTSSFRLGGVPGQNVVASVLNNARAGNTGFLRGYEPGVVVGQQFHLANIEYRQELWNIETGAATLPFYIRKLHVAGLFDVGNAFNNEIDLSEFKTSLGVSLRLDVLIGYFIPGALDIGYSRGLAEEGINEWWALLTGTI